MYKKCEEILKELESEGKLKVWWNFKFPEKEPLKTVLKDLLEKEVDEKYYLNDKQLIALKYSTCARDFKDPKCIQIGNLDIKGNDSIKRVYSPEGICPTLTTCGGGNTEPKILSYVDKKYNDFVKNKGYFPKMFNPYNCKEIENVAPTQTTQCGSTASSATVLVNNKTENVGSTVRKLIPLECWRLMGFDDEDFYKAQNVGISNSQLYKQAGNSIVVKVLEKIFLNLFKGD